MIQTRDIFDLYLLLTSKLDKVDLSEELYSDLNNVKDNILSLDFIVFRSQVIPYLESEDQPRFDSEEVWDNIRLDVVESLMRMSNEAC